MFIYKAGHKAKRGTYWESERNEKIELQEDGVLPGAGNVYYFKLPESYLLIPGLLAGLGLAMAMPYGIGLVVFVAIIAVTGATYAAGSACVKLVKEMLGRNAAFGYAPTTAYMTGKKAKKSRKEETTEEKEG